MLWLLGGLCVVGWLACCVLALGLGRAAQRADRQLAAWRQEEDDNEREWRPGAV